MLEDKIIKDGSYHIDQGVGVRAVSGEKTGFAYADQISLNALRQSSEAARSIVREQAAAHALSAVLNRSLYAPVNPLDSLTREDKIALLHRVDKVARTADPRVQEVNASLSGVYEQVLVAATDGTLAADIRPLVRLSISVQVEDQGKRERGASGGGARTGYEFFLADESGDAGRCWAREAVRMALVNLSAVAAPAGTLPVVLGAGWRACCCTKRWATVWKEISTAARLPSSAVRWASWWRPNSAPWLMTEPFKGLRGSLAVDDEGVPGQYNVLIENGVLKGYMQDKLNARLMGVPPTGNGVVNPMHTCRCRA